MYHLAWMLGEFGYRVVAADLDPQANLTSYFLDEDELEGLWQVGEVNDVQPSTVYGSLSPLSRGIGDVVRPRLWKVTDDVGLIPGDLRLSASEDELSSQWSECLDGKERAFRVISAFCRMSDMAAQGSVADVVLVDVGPNFGAINRAALVASDHVLIPLAPDLFSVQGLVNLGPRLREWRRQWAERLPKNPAQGGLPLPTGAMRPTGYVLLEHRVRLGSPVTAYRRWMDRIPGDYQRAVLGRPSADPVPLTIESDPNCLAQLKHYRSLAAMA